MKLSRETDLLKEAPEEEEEVAEVLEEEGKISEVDKVMSSFKEEVKDLGEETSKELEAKASEVNR